MVFLNKIISEDDFMKRSFAFIITVLMIFLCACSNQNDKEESSTAAETTTEAVVQAKDWGTDLLPEDFPPPPDDARDISVTTGSGSDKSGSYRSDWVRLTFTSSQKCLLDFSMSLNKIGYKGKAKLFTDTTYYKKGFSGNWQNGKKLVRISSSKQTEQNDYIINLDILDCTDNFPEALETIFPKFNGYTKSGGYFYAYNGIDDFVTNEFNGNFDTTEHWYWDFGLDHAFVGVEYEEYEAYLNALGDAGFGGAYTESIADGCSVASADMVKEIDGKTYACFMIYNQTTKVFDIVYTNHAERFTGISENEQ